MKKVIVLVVVLCIVLAGWFVFRNPHPLLYIASIFFSKDMTYTESLRFSPRLVEQKQADGSRIISVPAHKFQFLLPKEYDGQIEPSSGSISNRKWKKDGDSMREVESPYLHVSFSTYGIYLEPLDIVADKLNIKDFQSISGKTYEGLRGAPWISGDTTYFLVLFMNPLDRTHVLMRVQVTGTDIASYQNIIDTILSSFTYAGAVDFGEGGVLSGRVVKVSGNCTPPSNSCTYEGTQSTVVVYAEMRENTPMESRIKIATIATDENGNYSLKLAPGNYSIMVLVGGKEECAVKDGGGILCSATVNVDPIRYDPWINMTQKF